MDTRGRLLDVAEELFARQGVGNSSLREITSAADANLAAVHYHFGNKDGLLAAVVERRADPLSEERLKLLELTRTAAGAPPPTVRAILHAFIDPVFRAMREHPHFPTLMARVLMENLMPVVGDVFRRTFHETLLRFADALARSLPHLTIEEIRWRLLFTVGVFHFLSCGRAPIESVIGGASVDPEILVDRVIRYCEAGLAAPASPVRTEESP